jgi:COX assembly protein 2
MHPPLDRPHPDCQEEIRALQECHSTRSFWNVWACNEFKYAMDKCFRAEKQNLLKTLNKDMHQDRSDEEEAWKEATNQKMSFEQYLQKDKAYQEQKQQKSDASNYQTKSTGAHSD